MRKIAFIGILFFMIGSTMALTAYDFETRDSGSSKIVFKDGEKITFLLNASDDQDYNITIDDSNGSRIVDDQPMTQLSGAPFYNYQYNHTLDTSEGGTWEAFVNMTINKETTFTSTEFHVATDKPRIYQIDRPDFVTINDEFEIRLNVSDSQKNIKNSTIFFENGNSYSLENTRNGSNYLSYRWNNSFSSKGQRNYEAVIWDQNSNRDSSSGNFKVNPEDSEGVTFDVNVSQVCRANLEFDPLGAETAEGYSVMTTGAASNFTTNIENNANTNISKGRANITVDIVNVTFEARKNKTFENVDFENPGGTDYEGSFLRTVHNYTNFSGYNSNSTDIPPRDILEFNDTSNEYYVEEYDNNSFQRQFNKSDANKADEIGAGWYATRVYGDIDCGFDSANFSDYFPFRLLSIADAQKGGAAETGPEESENNPSEGPNLNDSLSNTEPGDNARPGQTEVPVPEPEPEPEPIPQLSMDIEPQEDTYQTPPGQYVSVNLTVTNEGNTGLNDLEIVPQLVNRTGWNASQASISSLGIGETKSREILIRSAPDTDPGSYVIPVLGSNQQNDLDIDYFTVEITEEPLPPELRSQLNILEAPRSLNILQDDRRPIPVLLENTGRTNLTNITGRIQNLDDCGTATMGTVGQLKPNETASLNVTFSAASQSARCNTTLIVSSEEGAYAFNKMNFEIVPPEGLIPREFEVPFVAIAWTSLLSAFAVLRRKYDLDSVLFKAPFILLVMGETLIITFLVVEYYGLVSVSFLPF